MPDRRVTKRVRRRLVRGDRASDPGDQREYAARSRNAKGRTDDGRGRCVNRAEDQVFRSGFDPKERGWHADAGSAGKTIENGRRLVANNTPALIRRPFSTSTDGQSTDGGARGNGERAQADFDERWSGAAVQPARPIPARGSRSCSRPPKATSTTSTRGCFSACRARCRAHLAKVCRRQGYSIADGIARLHLQRRSQCVVDFSRSAPDPGWSPTGEHHGACVRKSRLPLAS